jgi:hypothetical protein
MKRSAVLAAVMLVGLSACDRSEVVVETAVAETAGAAPSPVPDLPVRLLPYDRDEIIDSLTRAYGKPEPAVPPDLAQQQDSLRGLEAEWRRLSAGGSSAPTAGRLDPGADGVKQRLARLRPQIAALRRVVGARLDSLRAARREWAGAALADFDSLAEARASAADRREVADTTGADGTATFHVDEGRWWVYARYALPDEELYWNFPVEVAGKTTRVRLDEGNVERRPGM